MPSHKERHDPCAASVIGAQAERTWRALNDRDDQERPVPSPRGSFDRETVVRSWQIVVGHIFRWNARGEVASEIGKLRRGTGKAVFRESTSSRTNAV